MSMRLHTMSSCELRLGKMFIPCLKLDKYIYIYMYHTKLESSVMYILFSRSLFIFSPLFSIIHM